MNTGTFPELAAKWLERLRERCADPGFRAALRHWLSESPKRRARSYPALMDVRGTLDDEAFNTVAALYAFHPDHRADGSSPGRLCQRLAADLSTFEGRFKRLLSCEADQLPQQLRPLVFAAHARGVPVDYLRLYLDLRSWSHDHFGEAVRKRWATDFWGPREALTTQPDTATA